MSWKNHLRALTALVLLCALSCSTRSNPVQTHGRSLFFTVPDPEKELSSQHSGVLWLQGKNLGIVHVGENRYQVRGIPTNSGYGSLFVSHFDDLGIEWDAGTEDVDLGEVQLQQDVVLALEFLHVLGDPVPGVLIECNPVTDFGQPGKILGVRRSANREGRALLGGFPVGTNYFRVSHPGYVSRDLTCDLESGWNSEVVILQRATSVQGRLTIEGEPAKGMCTLKSPRIDEHGKFYEKAVVDTDGRFEFCAPAGSPLTLVAQANGAVPRQQYLAGMAAGECADIGDVELRRGLSLVGVVLDSDGVAIAGAGVELEPERVEGIERSLVYCMQSYASTASRGEFELTGLVDGEYLLSAFAPGFEDFATLVRIPQVEGTLVVRLVPNEN